MNNFIISGSLFGDEGKGSVCDYLANEYNIKNCVRYNGGSQASHTVSNFGVVHRFSQLGSLFMNEDVRTYLSDNTIVNPFNIITEAKVFREKCNLSLEEIVSSIYISNNAFVVTPYHTLINKIRELSRVNPIGTTGSGVSEVYRVFEENGIIFTMHELLKMNDETIYKLRSLFSYCKYYFELNKNAISSDLLQNLIDQRDIYLLTNDVNRDYLIKCYSNLFASNLLNLTENFQSFYNGKSVLFEGSQGLLLDLRYGIKPNVSTVDTTNAYAKVLSDSVNISPIKIGCTSSVISRHGIGAFPTNDKYLDLVINDKNQDNTYFQGKIRFGWFDAVLMRYSQRVNGNDYLFLSMLDRLSGIDEIKICTSYEYHGFIDEEFEMCFDYVIDNSKIIILDIKEMLSSVKTYLEKCNPIYITLKGFNENISFIKSVMDLPDECLIFINTIENLIKTPISHVSVGCDRNQKLEMRHI